MYSDSAVRETFTACRKKLAWSILPVLPFFCASGFSLIGQPPTCRTNKHSNIFFHFHLSSLPTDAQRQRRLEEPSRAIESNKDHCRIISATKRSHHRRSSRPASQAPNFTLSCSRREIPRYA